MDKVEAGRKGSKELGTLRFLLIWDPYSSDVPDLDRFMYWKIQKIKAVETCTVWQGKWSDT